MKALFLITISLSFIIFSFNSQLIIDGGFQKTTFDSNNQSLNSALKVFSEKVLKMRPLSELIPIAVYTQIVNGINYKIVVVIKDSSNYSVSIVNSTIYVSFFNAEPPMIESMDIVFKNNSGLDTNKNIQIRRVIENELTNTTNGGDKKIKLVSVQTYENLVLDDNYFVVNAIVEHFGVEFNQYYILSEPNNAKGFLNVENMVVLKNFEF